MFYKMMCKRLEKCNRKANRRLEDERRSNREYRRKTAELRKALARERREKAVLVDGYIVEWCCHCESQIVMLWNPEKDGLSAFCPVCGSRLMLCDSCCGKCDYNYGNDTCKEM